MDEEEYRRAADFEALERERDALQLQATSMLEANRRSAEANERLIASKDAEIASLKEIIKQSQKDFTSYGEDQVAQIAATFSAWITMKLNAISKRRESIYEQYYAVAMPSEVEELTHKLSDEMCFLIETCNDFQSIYEQSIGGQR